MKQNAIEHDEQIIRQHVELYGNDYSIDLGAEGKHSVEKLLISVEILKSIQQIYLFD